MQQAISIHVLREEDDGPSRSREDHCHRISIHVLREEDDVLSSDSGAGIRNFYPRPPRGGRRLKSSPVPTRRVFLSTSSARRTTKCKNPSCKREFISIHVLREEDDTRRWSARPHQNYFYPRPPRGGRRVHRHLDRALVVISIHVLREEDDEIADALGVTVDISIHVLREEDDRSGLSF